MTITTIGIDLAKNVFQIHDVDGSGKTVLKKQLRRNQVLTYFIKLTTCTIGIEACGDAHYWARKLTAMGHTVKLMAPQFVKPYVKANKNDAADAEAICEAVTRPNMRFVAIKNVEQQAILSLESAGSEPLIILFTKWVRFSLWRSEGLTSVLQWSVELTDHCSLLALLDYSPINVNHEH